MIPMIRVRFIIWSFGRKASFHYSFRDAFAIVVICRCGGYYLLAQGQCKRVPKSSNLNSDWRKGNSIGNRNVTTRKEGRGRLRSSRSIEFAIAAFQTVT